MRRGLIAWNPDEIGMDVLDGRLARLRDAMAEAGLDGMILYTNFVRPAAVAFMSSFSPYWADAILFIPKTGRPTFATSMSTRMNTWIRSVNPVGEIVNTRRPGAHVGAILAADPDARRVGVVEIDMLPNGIHGDLVATATGVEFAECGDVFAKVRGVVDPTELTLLRKAASLAESGLAAVDTAAMHDAGAVVAVVEQQARLGGAEEAYIAIAPDLDAEHRFARLSGDAPLGRSFAVRASVAYKGVWVRHSRTYSNDASVQAVVRRADDWFEDTLDRLTTGTAIADQLSAAAARIGATVEGWLLETSVGTYPLRAVDPDLQPAMSLSDGAYCCISLTLSLDGVIWQGAAPVIIGRTLARPEQLEDAA